MKGIGTGTAQRNENRRFRKDMIKLELSSEPTDFLKTEEELLQWVTYKSGPMSLPTTQQGKKYNHDRCWQFSYNILSGLGIKSNVGLTEEL